MAGLPTQSTFRLTCPTFAVQYIDSLNCEIKEKDGLFYLIDSSLEIEIGKSIGRNDCEAFLKTLE